MGIKFRCPECDKKLHVKGYLAGKRGVCPHCSVKLEIPLESQLKSKKDGDVAGEEMEMPPPPVPQSHADRPDSTVAPVGLAPPEAVAPASPQGSPVPVQPVAAAPTAMPQSADTPHYPAAAPAANAPAQAPAQAFGATPATTQPAPMASPPSNHDPLSEAPEASWYVRFTSGDQFGPAKGPEMQRWLEEGRVAPESLVWREGWADWKRADATFPWRFSAVPAARPQVQGMPAPQTAPAYQGVPAARPAPMVAQAVVARPMAAPAVARPVGMASIPTARPAGMAAQDDDGGTDTREFLRSVVEEKHQRESGSGTEQGPAFAPRKQSNAGMIAAIALVVIALTIIPLAIYVVTREPGTINVTGSSGPSLDTMIYQIVDRANCKVKMPISPGHNSELRNETTAAGGQVRSTDFKADVREDLGYTFELSFGRINDPLGARNRAGEFFRSSAENNTRFLRTDSVGSPRDIQLGQFQGREYRLDGGSRRMRLQIFLVNDKRYMLSALAESGYSLDADIVNEFFNSFRLLNLPNEQVQYGRR